MPISKIILNIIGLICVVFCFHVISTMKPTKYVEPKELYSGSFCLVELETGEMSDIVFSDEKHLNDIVILVRRRRKYNRYFEEAINEDTTKPYSTIDGDAFVHGKVIKIYR